MPRPDSMAQMASRGGTYDSRRTDIDERLQARQPIEIPNQPLLVALRADQRGDGQGMPESHAVAARKLPDDCADLRAHEAEQAHLRLSPSDRERECARKFNASKENEWWPQRDSNPCRGLERAVS